MTAEQVLDVLRGHFLGRGALETDEWSLLTEVTLPITQAPQAGGVPTWGAASSARIDVLLVRNWSGQPNPHERVAIEIKVSRADFFRDTEAKRGPWVGATNRFVYAVPAGLVSAAEVPDGCSLLEVFDAPIMGVAPTHRDFGKQVHWAKTVRRRAAGPLLEAAWRQGVRRASRAEEQVRRGGGNDAEQVAALVEELRKVTHQRDAARTRAAAETARRKETERVVSVLLPQVCATCGETIKVASTANWMSPQWVHKVKGQDGICRQGQLDAGKSWADQPHPASLSGAGTPDVAVP